jgi:hypothetical protein
MSHVDPDTMDSDTRKTINDRFKQVYAGLLSQRAALPRMSSALGDRAEKERGQSKSNTPARAHDGPREDTPAPIRRPALRNKTEESGKGSKIVSGLPESLDTHQNPEAPRDKTQSSHKQGNKQHKARPTKLEEKASYSETLANTENDSIIGLDALNVVVDSKDEDLTPLRETMERERVAERRNRNRVQPG